MNTRQAMVDLREIGEILARAQHSSCFRPAPIAATAVVAMMAAAFASWRSGPMVPSDAAFVGYWSVAALINASIVGLDLAIRYCRTDSELHRSKTRVAIYQFAPSLAIGGYATGCLMASGDDFRSILPGLWCLIVALGIFATLGNAPPGMIFPATFYAVVGGIFWRWNDVVASLGPWSMGLAFGIGQAWVAFLLWRGFRNG